VGRWNTTSPLPADLISLLCVECGHPLSGGDEAALFVCPMCGAVHAVGEKTLVPFPASTVTVTSDLAVAGPVQYLAVWRLLPASVADDDPVWESIRRAAGGDAAYLYVPAFSMARRAIQRLGVRLTETQPMLALEAGAPVERLLHPAVAEARSSATALPGADESGDTVDFDAVSPVLVGTREAWGLAHFIYMAIEAHELHELRPEDLQLQPGKEDLLFVPAMWDPRYIHESNWRLLLREFDGLVA
jgi:hypothetical protein